MFQVKNVYMNVEPSPGELFTEPTLTVPDQELTVSEILSQFTTNEGYEEYLRRLDGNFTGIDEPETEEFDDELAMDLRTMDLTELQDLKTDVQERIKKLRKDLEDSQKPVPAVPIPPKAE